MYKTTFTLSEAADILSCHAETLRRSIKDGVLRAARLGREYRISRSDLQAFWTERGGGELFPEQNTPPEPDSEKIETLSMLKTQNLHTNGPKQLSLLIPGGISHE
ncbi:MAG: helix-turn-helix domain-containing protein [Desulfovibrionaceae bacterium]